MALGATDDGVNAGDQFVLVKGLGHVVVGTEAQTAHLVLDAGHAREDEDGRFHLRQAQRAQNLVTRHIGQVQVEQDNVVVIQLSKVDAFFTEVRRVHVEALRLEHQFDALCRGAVILD